MGTTELIAVFCLLTALTAIVTHYISYGKGKRDGYLLGLKAGVFSVAKDLDADRLGREL